MFWLTPHKTAHSNQPGLQIFVCIWQGLTHLRGRKGKEKQQNHISSASFIQQSSHYVRLPVTKVKFTKWGSWKVFTESPSKCLQTVMSVSGNLIFYSVEVTLLNYRSWYHVLREGKDALNTHTHSNTSLQGGQRADSTARDFKDPIVFKRPDGHCDKYTVFHHQFKHVKNTVCCLLVCGPRWPATFLISFVVLLAEKDELLFSIPILPSICLLAVPLSKRLLMPCLWYMTHHPQQLFIKWINLKNANPPAKGCFQTLHNSFVYFLSSVHQAGKQQGQAQEIWKIKRI